MRLKWCGVRIANTMFNSCKITKDADAQFLAVAMTDHIRQNQMISVPTEKGEREMAETVWDSYVELKEKLVELLNSLQDYGIKRTPGLALPGLPCNEIIADHLIANGVTVVDKFATTEQEWISVKDRLPDCADTVLAVDRDGIMGSAYYVGFWHTGGELDEYAVTHWMPLPKPPEGE